MTRQRRIRANESLEARDAHRAFQRHDFWQRARYDPSATDSPGRTIWRADGGSIALRLYYRTRDARAGELLRRQHWLHALRDTSRNRRNPRHRSTGLHNDPAHAWV